MAGDGGIFSFGDAQFYGSTGSLKLNKPVVGLSATASGSGYWFVATDGGIFSYEIGSPTGDWPGTLIYLGGPLNWNPRGVDGAFDSTRFNRNSAQQLSNNVRTFPTKFAGMRGDSGQNVDCSILKNIRVKERVALQFRAEFLNAFNHAAFSGPQLNPTASNFGTITGVVNLERHIQMALRLTW